MVVVSRRPGGRCLACWFLVLSSRHWKATTIAGSSQGERAAAGWWGDGAWRRRVGESKELDRKWWYRDDGSNNIKDGSVQRRWTSRRRKVSLPSASSPSPRRGSAGGSKAYATAQLPEGSSGITFPLRRAVQCERTESKATRARSLSLAPAPPRRTPLPLPFTTLGGLLPPIGFAIAAFAATASVATPNPTPVLRAARFWRTALPIVAHYRFAQWWLGSATRAPRRKRDEVYGQLHRKYCHPVHNLILDLRGLYAKIGQVLSSRPDFVPPEYVELFATVQDSIPPWPIEQIKEILLQSLRDELGLEMDQVFESIDPVALGSASIGQVHAAVLKDEWAGGGGSFPDDSYSYYGSGPHVAIKVMHPGAKDCFRHDFQVFRWLCRLALPSWMGLLDELERRIMTEFDYQNEAQSLSLVRTNLERSPYRRQVCVPQPHLRLCCRHVLVMELLHGKKLVDDVQDRLDAALGEPGFAARLLRQRHLESVAGAAPSTGVFLPELDSASLPAKLRLRAIQRRCKRFVELLVDVHGYQIFVDGAFNADPHPGNVMVLRDGRLGLIDYGQTRRLDVDERLAFAQVVLALGEGSDEASVAEHLCRSGFVPRDPDDAATLAQYATLFFDSDHESRDRGFATPQLYYASLMRLNPLTVIPDAAVFIARTSFLFRGMGAVVGSGAIRTAQMWMKHAQAALDQEAAAAPGTAAKVTPT